MNHSIFDDKIILLAFFGDEINHLVVKRIAEDINKEGINGILLNTEKEFPSYKFYSKNRFQELDGLVVLGK